MKGGENRVHQHPPREGAAGGSADARSEAAPGSALSGADAGVPASGARTEAPFPGAAPRPAAEQGAGRLPGMTRSGGPGSHASDGRTRATCVVSYRAGPTGSGSPGPAAAPAAGSSAVSSSAAGSLAVSSPAVSSSAVSSPAV